MAGRHLWILAALLAAGCATESTLPPPPVLVRTTPAESAEAMMLVSRYRLAHGLNAVRLDTGLGEAAEMQARAVAEAGQLSHGDFEHRMARFGAPSIAAENLGAGVASVPAVMAMWRRSPGHDANLLLADVERIGIAHVETPDAGYRTYWALELAK